MSSDKWRFDPNADYSSDDYGGGGKQFQRFKNKGKGKKSKGHKGGHGSRNDKRNYDNDRWR